MNDKNVSPTKNKMNYENLALTVDVRPGTTINKAFTECCALATKMGLTVAFTFNGVQCKAVPNTDPANGVKQWDAAIKSKVSPKYINSYPT